MTGAFGLDLLARQAWRATATDDGIGEVRTSTRWLPTAMLPLRRSEIFQPGMDVEAHRRGRGLAWPPEAQAPVLRRASNGIGRLPMAAVLEFLVCQERSWGRLDQDQVTWSPDGRDAVSIEVRRLIAQTVQYHLPELRLQRDVTLGLVVPSLLQPAGQQVIVDACQDRGAQALLVPSTIAPAIAWAHSPAAEAYRARATTGEGTLVGHLMVIDAGLGPWVATRVPLYAVVVNDRSWLVPVRLPRRYHATIPGPCGWQVLTAVARHRSDDWLPRLVKGPWLDAILSGTEHLDRDACSGATVADASGIASLCGLENGHSGSLDDLARHIGGVVTGLPSHDVGPCLGCVVVGAMADIQVAGSSVRDLLARKTGVQALETPATDSVLGAAWAALGYAQNPAWPTWRETLEPIDIYYVGKDERGDPASCWMPLIQASTVAAGSDYRNDKPIRGLALERGSTRVRMILRRERETLGTYDYRAVYTKTVADFQSAEQMPLDVNVHSRAGQGFSVVQVTARHEQRFSTALDWMSMETTPRPEQPRLGYIPTSLKIRSEPNIYAAACPALTAFAAALKVANGQRGTTAAQRDNVETYALAALKGVNKLVSADYWARKNRFASTNDAALFYAVVSRDGTVHPSCDREPIREALAEAERWLERMSSMHSATKRVRRFCAYLYWMCPVSVYKAAVRRAAESRPRAVEVDASDLQILGLATRVPKDYHTVYRLVADVLPGSKSANHYLRSLRDITRLNDDSLSDEALSDDLCTSLTEAVVNYLDWAAAHHKKLVVANCIEALLFMLKRRRYAPTYLSESVEVRQRLDRELANLWGTNVDVIAPWLSKKCIRHMDMLRKFLTYAATQEDADLVISESGDDDDDDDDGG